MKLTREEMEIIDYAFEYISDEGSLKPEEEDLWEKIRHKLQEKENIAKTFSISFTGHCDIEATTEAEATTKFYHYLNNDEPLPHNDYDITFIDEL